jgi:hypothetical protein
MQRITKINVQQRGGDTLRGERAKSKGKENRDLAWIAAFDCAAAASCYAASCDPVFKGVFILLIARASG